MDAVWTNVIHPNQLFNIEKLTELDSNILILIYFWHKMSRTHLYIVFMIYYCPFFLSQGKCGPMIIARYLACFDECNCGQLQNLKYKQLLLDSNLL